MSDFSAMKVAGADTELSNERTRADLSSVQLYILQLASTLVLTSLVILQSVQTVSAQVTACGLVYWQTAY